MHKSPKSRKNQSQLAVDEDDAEFMEQVFSRMDGVAKERKSRPKNSSSRRRSRSKAQPSKGRSSKRARQGSPSKGSASAPAGATEASDQDKAPAPMNTGDRESTGSAAETKEATPAQMDTDDKESAGAPEETTNGDEDERGALNPILEDESGTDDSEEDEPAGEKKDGKRQTDQSAFMATGGSSAIDCNRMLKKKKEYFANITPSRRYMSCYTSHKGIQAGSSQVGLGTGPNEPLTVLFPYMKCGKTDWFLFGGHNYAFNMLPEPKPNPEPKDMELSAMLTLDGHQEATRTDDGKCSTAQSLVEWLEQWRALLVDHLIDDPRYLPKVKSSAIDAYIREEHALHKEAVQKAKKSKSKNMPPPPNPSPSDSACQRRIRASVNSCVSTVMTHLKDKKTKEPELSSRLYAGESSKKSGSSVLYLKKPTFRKYHKKIHVPEVIHKHKQLQDLFACGWVYQFSPITEASNPGVALPLLESDLKAGDVVAPLAILRVNKGPGIYTLSYDVQAWFRWSRKKTFDPARLLRDVKIDRDECAPTYARTPMDESSLLTLPTGFTFTRAHKDPTLLPAYTPRIENGNENCVD